GVAAGDQLWDLAGGAPRARRAPAGAVPHLGGGLGGLGAPARPQRGGAGALGVLRGAGLLTLGVPVPVLGLGSGSPALALGHLLGTPLATVAARSPARTPGGSDFRRDGGEPPRTLDFIPRGEGVSRASAPSGCPAGCPRRRSRPPPGCRGWRRRRRSPCGRGRPGAAPGR